MIYILLSLSAGMILLGLCVLATRADLAVRTRAVERIVERAQNMAAESDQREVDRARKRVKRGFESLGARVEKVKDDLDDL